MKRIPLIYYVWRGYEMSRRTTSMLKGIGIGLVLCMAAVEGCKLFTSVSSPKSRRKRCRLKQDANRAIRVVGDVIGDVEDMFLKK